MTVVFGLNIHNTERNLFISLFYSSDHNFTENGTKLYRYFLLHCLWHFEKVLVFFCTQSPVRSGVVSHG